MKISSFLISMLLVAGVVIGLYSFTENLASEQAYDLTINSSYKNTYDKIDELQNVTSSTQDRIQNITSREDRNFFTGTWDAIKVTKEVAFGSAKTTTTGLSIGTNLITDFLNDINLGGSNTYVGSIIIAILTILVLGAVIFLIIKRVW